MSIGGPISSPAEVALRLGLDARGRTPFEVLREICAVLATSPRASEHLGGLAVWLACTSHKGKPDDAEFDAVDDFLYCWNGITASHSLQALASSFEYLNGFAIWWSISLESLIWYLDALGRRIGAPEIQFSLDDAYSAADADAPTYAYLVDTMAPGLAKLVRLSDASAPPDDPPDAVRRWLRLVVRFIRLSGALRGEAWGSLASIQRSHAVVLRDRLFRLARKDLQVTVTTLELAIEHLLLTHVQSVASGGENRDHPESVRAVSNALPTVMAALQCHHRMLSRLGDVTAEAETLACFAAVTMALDPTFVYDPDTLIAVGGSLKNAARGGTLAQGLREQPLTSLLMAQWIKLSEFGALKHQALDAVCRALNQTPMQLLALILDVHTRFSLDPSSLPLDTTYRAVAKARFIACPPEHRYANLLVAHGDLATAALLSFSRASSTSVLTRVEPQDAQEQESYEAWRQRLCEAARQSRQTAVDAFFSPEPSLHGKLSSASKRHGLQSASFFDAFDMAGANGERYFGRSPQVALPQDASTGWRFQAPFVALRDSARSAGVELLFIGLGEHGLSVQHYEPQARKWHGVEGGAPGLHASQTVQMVSALRSRRQELETSQKAETLALGTGLRQFAADIVSTITDNLRLGARVAVLVAPELAPLGLVPALALRLVEAHASDAAVCEIDAYACTHRPPPNAAWPPLRRFAGYFDASLGGTELAWSDLGLAGDARSDFDATQVLGSLEQPDTVVHLVAHGRLNYRWPVYSHLETSKDPIFLMDLLGRRLRSPLLLVNCCHSAAEALAGSSVPSIARVAVRAGVGAAVANTQEVEHAAAHVFATAFQHALVSQRCSIAVAYCRGLGAAFPQTDRWAPVTAMAADLGMAFEAQ